MTANQINYLKHKEDIRSHKATESLEKTKAVETTRHNIAAETETRRSNLVTEAIKSNTLDETVRANKQKEAIDSYKAQAQHRRWSHQSATDAVETWLKQQVAYHDMNYKDKEFIIDKLQAEIDAFKAKTNVGTSLINSWSKVLGEAMKLAF